VDGKPRHHYRNGINWHRVIMWASLGVAIYLGAHVAVLKGPLPTLLDAEGREIAREALRDHFPDLAQRLGVRPRYAIPPTPPTRLHAR
jgi:hypothetical protein